jgi:hypothetical protein
MPCFRIHFVCPEFEQNRRNISNDRHVALLIHQYAAKLGKIGRSDGFVSYFTTLCEREAADFLRDLPPPFFVDAIVNTITEDYLYKNPKLYERYRNRLPQIKYEKEIFWNARQMERFMKN